MTVKIAFHTATIQNGQSLSQVIDLNNSVLTIIVMPAAWTSANLTFQTSVDGSTWANLFDDSGNEISVTVAQTRAVVLTGVEWLGIKLLKIRSGTAGSPVNQGAERDLTLITRI